MALKVFNNGDTPYLNWCDKFGNDGFVLNTGSGNRSSYGMLHLSSCHHITTYTRSQVDGAFTARTYFKICSDSTQEIFKWIKKNRALVNLKICKTCSPYSGVIQLPEELSSQEKYWEGSAKTIIVNAYERDARARNRCLEIHGYSCKICHMNFESEYGPECANFIHVHHLVPISTVGQGYQIDPETDLVPVCPNCHSVIHLGGQLRTIDEVKMLRRKIRT